MEDRQLLHAGTGEFQHLVLHETALEHGLHQGNGHVMRTDTAARLAFQPNQHHLGSIDVPRILEELFHQFAAAFANAHVTQGAVTGVGVGAQDHVAACGVLMDNRLVGRNIDATILFGGGKAEHVVVLVDGTAHCAQGIVAVGHGIRKRELFQSAGAGRLNDTDVGDVVGNHGIETDAKFLAFGAVHIMRTKNLIGDGILAGFVRSHIRLLCDGLSVQQINTMRN